MAALQVVAALVRQAADRAKGVKHVFETYLKPTRSELTDQGFVDLVPAIETAPKKLATVSLEEEERVRAYKAARNAS